MFTFISLASDQSSARVGADRKAFYPKVAFETESGKKFCCELKE